MDVSHNEADTLKPRNLFSKPTLTALVLITVAAALAVYANSLANGFVFDDEYQILGNPWIKDFCFIPTVFSSEAWAFMPDKVTNYYRPLVHLVYMVTYHLSGLNPWGFHSVNLLFHSGTSALVFLIGVELFRGSDIREVPPYAYPPFVAAVLFAVHPIHTEVVAWAAGIPELTYVFFSLASLYLYLVSFDKNRATSTTRCLLSVILFFFATLCKETALVLPAILVAHDFAFDRMKGKFPEMCMRYVPYLLAAALYFALRLHALGSFAPVNEHPGLTVYQCIINVFPLLAQYMGKLLLPTNLSALHEFLPGSSFFEARVILSVVAMLIIVIALVKSVRKAPIVFFGLFLVLVPLLPALYIRAIPYPFAERYLYLPSFGFVLTLSALAARFAITLRGGAAVALALAVGTGLYSAGTIRRNPVWKDNYSLWSDTVKKSPHVALAHNELGLALFNRGRLDEAIDQYNEALRIKPARDYTHVNLGIALINQGKVDEAIGHFAEALRINPSLERAHVTLGLALTEKGRIDEALVHYVEALRIKPDDATAHNILGMALAGRGELAAAIDHFSAAVRINPGYGTAHYNLGNALAEQGRLEEAVKHYRVARQINHADIAVSRRLELALTRLKKASSR